MNVVVAAILHLVIQSKKSLRGHQFDTKNNQNVFSK